MSQTPEIPRSWKDPDFSLEDEVERVRKGGTSENFIIRYLASRDPNEPGMLTEAFNEMSGGLRERLWMEAAVDEAGLMFEPKMDVEGKQIGLRLVLKPETASPQNLVDRV